MHKCAFDDHNSDILIPYAKYVSTRRKVLRLFLDIMASHWNFWEIYMETIYQLSISHAHAAGRARAVRLHLPLMLKHRIEVTCSIITHGNTDHEVMFYDLKVADYHKHQGSGAIEEEHIASNRVHLLTLPSLLTQIQSVTFQYLWLS